MRGKTNALALALISHHPSAAAADMLAVTGRAPCGRLNVVSTTLAPTFGPRVPSQRHLSDLATNRGEKCELVADDLLRIRSDDDPELLEMWAKYGLSHDGKPL